MSSRKRGAASPWTWKIVQRRPVCRHPGMENGPDVSGPGPFSKGFKGDIVLRVAGRQRCFGANSIHLPLHIQMCVLCPYPKPIVVGHEYLKSPVSQLSVNITTETTWRQTCRQGRRAPCNQFFLAFRLPAGCIIWPDRVLILITKFICISRPIIMMVVWQPDKTT